MAATKTKDVRLSDEDVQKILDLVKNVDSVELKLTVPSSDHRAVIKGLGLDPLDAQIRQVFFFDTPALDLNAAGVVVRARRIQGKGGDTVVKLRPVVPDQLPPALRKSAGFGIEVDAMPGGFVCSCSFKGKADATAVRETVLGEKRISKLFTKEQRDFYKQHAPDGLDLDDLAVLGPIFVLKLNFVPERLGRKLAAEFWLYPDGSRILELSTKCLPSEPFQVSAEARAFLTRHGVDLTGEQQTKTKTALEFFSSELQAAAAA
jgi:hypothetical protein